MRSHLFLILGHATRIVGRPLETRDDRRQVDAIVVLGAPLCLDGTLSLAGRERVNEGVMLWKRGVAPLLAFCGGAAHSAAEAPAMAAAAIALGVPSEVTIVEDRSKTTAENALYTAPLLRDRNVRSVLIVSQPFHLRRGRRLFRQKGFRSYATACPQSVQYKRPDLAVRWVIREYVAWAAHFVLLRP